MRQTIKWILVVVAVIGGVLLAGKIAFADVDMDVVAQIESSGRSWVINERTQAYGLYQITQVALDDFNYWGRGQGDAYFILDDMLDKDQAFTVANWYMNDRIPVMLKHYRRADSTKNRLIAYNCGIGCVIRGNWPNETKNYLKRYSKLTGEVLT